MIRYAVRGRPRKEKGEGGQELLLYEKISISKKRAVQIAVIAGEEQRLPDLLVYSGYV